VRIVAAVRGRRRQRCGSELVDGQPGPGTDGFAELGGPPGGTEVAASVVVDVVELDVLVVLVDLLVVLVLLVVTGDDPVDGAGTNAAAKAVGR
jgi:hypothetical protein